MKIVLANGCFDLIHAGHIMHLREARSMGDILIVSLTLDDYVRKGAGRPVNKWEDRAAVLRELRSVNAVIPSRGADEAILEVMPDIFVKGVDYVSGNRISDAAIAACAKVGAEIRYTASPKRSAYLGAP